MQSSIKQRLTASHIDKADIKLPALRYGSKYRGER
jgi:hypothetical protein